jgi:hypothetical protein
MLGRCYWRLGQLAMADRAFRTALQNKEGSNFYLNLCLQAIERSAPATRGTASAIFSRSIVH